MKRIIFIIIMTLGVISLSYAQQQFKEPLIKRDTVAFMRLIEKEKKEFLGKHIGNIYSLFKALNVPIRFIGFARTSPWIDPEGKSYMKKITICYLRFWDIEKKRRLKQPATWLNIVVGKPYPSTTEVKKLIDYDISDENKADIIFSSLDCTIEDIYCSLCDF